MGCKPGSKKPFPGESFKMPKDVFGAGKAAPEGKKQKGRKPFQF